MQKCTNENAARFPPLLSTVVSQKDIDFRRFLVALVDLSEPNPYDDQKDRIEPRRWNHSFSDKIKVRGKLYEPCSGRSTRNRRKSHAHVHFDGDAVPIRWTETGKS